MKALVNDSCIACELCVMDCPEVFSMNEDSKSVAIDLEIPTEFRDSAKAAAVQCPVSAIIIEE